MRTRWIVEIETPDGLAGDPEDFGNIRDMAGEIKIRISPLPVITEKDGSMQDGNERSPASS